MGKMKERNIKNKYYIIYYIVILISLNSLVITAYNYEKTLNTTQLPYSENISFYLLTGNYTTNLTFISSSSFLSFISNVTLYGDENITGNMSLNVSIYLNNLLLPSNYIEYIYIQNSFTNLTSNLSFFFQIINATYNLTTNLTNQTTSSYIQLTNKEFVYQICKYSLPYTTFHTIPILTPLNTVINFTGQNILGFNSINTSSNPFVYNVSINLNTSLSVGQIDEILYIKSENISDNLTFHFRIIDCLVPPPNIDLYKQNCNFTKMQTNISADEYFDEFMLCYGTSLNYLNDYYNTFQVLNRTRYLENKTTVFEEKRVPVEMIGVENIRMIMQSILRENGLDKPIEQPDYTKLTEFQSNLPLLLDQKLKEAIEKENLRIQELKKVNEDLNENTIRKGFFYSALILISLCITGYFSYNYYKITHPF